MALSPGTRLGRYEIRSSIGTGGMGEVYLAEDVKLERSVALKILPTEVASDQQRMQRFTKEAKAASSLNHPNIITIHEIDEVDSAHFIATEFIDGVTLRRQMSGHTPPPALAGASRADGRAASGAPMKLQEVLDITTQVASALAAAHAAGIVHRDIKPENIMLRPDGYVKVLDFGLAKLTEKAARQQWERGVDSEAATVIGETEPGIVMGTANYMSPEQARGLRVDERTDIFSLGVVLYEMVTGRRPFEGDTTSDVLVSILEKDPPPAARHAPDVPTELDRIIAKALEKDRALRYQSILEMRVDLARLKRDMDSGRMSAFNPTETVVAATTHPPHDGLDTFDTGISDTDESIILSTRFSKVSAALALLAVVSAVAGWWAYHRRSVEAELKLGAPRVAALSKAREIVGGFGYDAAGLDESVTFEATKFDLRHVADKLGREEARRAVREGKVAAWKVTLTRPKDEAFPDEDAALKVNEYSVELDPAGRLVSFFTPHAEGADVAEPERERSHATAREAVARHFSIDPEAGGYEMEYVPRAAPSGIAEVTWRKPAAVFDHHEVVRVALQGPRITKLSRTLTPAQTPSPAAKEKGGVAGDVERARAVLISVAVLGAYVLGLIIAIKRRAGEALRRRLPVAACLMMAAGLLTSVLVTSDAPVEALAIYVIMIVLGVVACFPAFAGLFEWLRTSRPARVHGAQQLVRGRFFSKPVASSIVHGVLGGALLFGIEKIFNALKDSVPGSAPDFSNAVDHINQGSPVAYALMLMTVGALWLFILVALTSEVVERLARGGVVAVVVPALLVATLMIDYSRPPLAAGLDFTSAFLSAAFVVQLYRSRGFAAGFLAVAFFFPFDMAMSSRAIGDSGFVFQSNLLLLVTLLVLAAGVWGYVGPRLTKDLNSFELK
ncbi:MAG: protein kinase domain-containing protein [Pyrinomonadaceae bacterium]